MDDSFDSSLEFTLAEEGGFIDRPDDPRFAANHGITLVRLRRFVRDRSHNPQVCPAGVKSP